MPDGTSSRREHLVRSAIALLAASGPRALTHRGVDAAAGLPPGSTSNVFRTRAALVDGVIAHLLALDEDRIGRLASVPSPGAAAAAFITDSLRDGARVVLARAALLADPDATGLVAARARLVAAVDRAAGGREVLRPGGAALVVAALDGVLLEAARSGVEPDPRAVADAFEAMHRALHAAAPGGSGRAAAT